MMPRRPLRRHASDIVSDDQEVDLESGNPLVKFGMMLIFSVYGASTRLCATGLEAGRTEF